MVTKVQRASRLALKGQSSISGTFQNVVVKVVEGERGESHCPNLKVQKAINYVNYTQLLCV